MSPSKVIFIIVAAFVFTAFVIVYFEETSSIVVETVVECPAPPPEIKTCTPSYETKKACAKCCMNKIWPPNKEPDYGQPYESAHCAESCLRVTEALCLDDKYVTKDCKAIADGY